MNIRISTDIENQIYRHLQNPNEENEGKLFSIVRPALRDDIKRLKEVLNKIVTTGDQEVIIKELDKEKESIRRAYSSSQEKEDNESQELKSFRAELSAISLSENIAYLKALTNKTPENYKKLINDSIRYLFQRFEEAYKESKCDTRIIGAIIGDYTHFLVRNLYTLTHYEDYETQSKRSIDINTSVAKAFENSQNVLLQATREKDETKKNELMREYESFNAEFNAHREELLILQNSLYDESFQGVNINAKIEKFLKKLNPLIEAKDIPTDTEAYIQEVFGGNESFYKIHQGISTNKLIGARGKISDSRQINKYGAAVIKQADFQLTFEDYSHLLGGITTTAKLLLDTFTIKVTDSGDPLVTMPLKEYAEKRKLSDLKTLRQQVLRDMDLLKNIKFDYEEKIKGKYVRSGDISLYGGTGVIENGKIKFRFNPDFFAIIKDYPVMPYSKELLTFRPNNNPYSYNLYRKISSHKNMNYFKPTADIISVKSLIAACPEMPTYEELSPKGQARQRIMDPFERDMNNISDINWEYCGKNGVPIDYPERYEDFIKANVKISWVVPYPTRKAPIKKKKTLK